MIKPVLFGKFCLLERISVGGMAEVFRAKTLDNPNVQRYLAIKRILPNLAEDDEFISMFIDEAKISVQLTHRNIAQIYELGHLDGSYYIVMEFVSGRDILAIQNQLRRDKRIMSVGQAVYLTRQIALGLDFAHRKTDANGNPLGIIHRDISPQNILVSYNGEVKVIDFGIAKAATRSNKTQVGVLKGKFGYMSPEQVRGKELDRRSDIFALGTLMHELLTCRRLFHGESDFATLEMVRKVDIQPPSAFNPNVPPEIDAIVMKALAADPDERYGWCSEMADDLHRFLAMLRPPYTERILEDWMQKTFSERLEKERKKIHFFSQINSMQDVELYNQELQRQIELKRQGIEPQTIEPEPAMTAQATMIWDAQKQGLFEEEADPAKDMANKATQIFQAPEDMPAPVPGAGGLIERVLRAGPPPPMAAHDPTGFIPPEQQASIHTQPRAAYPAPPQPASGGSSMAAPVLVAGIGLLLLAGAAAALLLTGALDGVLGSAEPVVVVNTSPTQEVEVLVNGKLRATRTPFTATDLTPGTYTVEIRHADFLPAVERVEVARGARSELHFSLKPRPVGKAIVTYQVDPADAALYVDGVRSPESGAVRVLELDDQREHLVEVVAAGYAPVEHRLAVSDGEKLTRDARLAKVSGEIEVTCTAQGTVYLNGEKIGKAPQTLRDLSPHRVHELTVDYPGYAPWGKAVLFDRSYKKSYTVTLRPGGGEAKIEKPEVGYLAVDSGPTWWRLIIDGFDTQLTTPLQGEQRLVLPVGKHAVHFVRGDTTHKQEIDVRAGETVNLKVAYAFKW